MTGSKVKVKVTSPWKFEFLPFSKTYLLRHLQWAGAALGGEVQGSGPPSPDQGHLWESPRSDEFLWTGGVGVVPWHVCQWPSDSTPVSPQRTGSRHDIINNTVFFIFLSLPLSTVYSRHPYGGIFPQKSYIPPKTCQFFLYLGLELSIVTKS